MQLSGQLAINAKKAQYAYNFIRGRLVHTNLQLLYDCNFRCQICDFWRPGQVRRPRLSAAQVAVIAEKLGRIGPQIVSIGGGEPLLHPELVEIVRLLSRQHFPVMICNGWFVTPERARALFEAGIYEVSISVDYADPDRHDRQRGMPGAHRRALEALEVLERSRVHPWQRVHMISVVLDDNLGDLPVLIERCADLGITYLVTLYSDARGKMPSRSLPRDLGERLLELKARYPRFVALRGYLARFSEAARQGGVGGCQAGRLLCNVDSQGAVSLCIDRVDEPVGNLLDDPVETVVAALGQAHRRNRCTGCWTSCRGSIESVRRPREALGNLLDYVQMTREAPLGA